MSKSGYLLQMRIKLDEAITYGTSEEALVLAQRGLKEAREKGWAGENAYFQGQVELINERFAAAIEYFDLAIRHNPKDGAAYNDRALCMVEIGIIDEAFRYFDKGIEVEPDYATVYHNKGWLLNNIGRHSEAVAYFKKALELEPARAVTYDNLADALMNLGDYRGAHAAYRRVLELLKPGRCDEIREQVVSHIKVIEERLSDEKS